MGSCWHDQTEMQCSCKSACYIRGVRLCLTHPALTTLTKAQTAIAASMPDFMPATVIVLTFPFNDFQGQRARFDFYQMGSNCLEHIHTHTSSEIFMESFPRRLRRLVELVTVVRGRQSSSSINIYMCRLDHFLWRTAFYFA